MRRLIPTLMATAALTACGAPAETTVKGSAEAAAPAPIAATYTLATADAVARWAEVEPMADPVPSSEQGHDCHSLMGRQVAVRICSIDGRVASMVATSRPDATLEALDRSIDTMAELVAPGAEEADLTRIAAAAADGLAGAGTTLCPTIRCFRITPTQAGWVLAANAGQG